MSTEETEIMMTRKRNTILASAAVLAAAGLGAGVAVAATGSSGQPPAPAPAAGAAAYASPSYSWYQSMMTGYYGTGTGMILRHLLRLLRVDDEPVRLPVDDRQRHHLARLDGGRHPPGRHDEHRDDGRQHRPGQGHGHPVR
jgi:hypothetical protein